MQIAIDNPDGGDEILEPGPLRIGLAANHSIDLVSGVRELFGEVRAVLARCAGDEPHGVPSPALVETPTGYHAALAGLDEGVEDVGDFQ
jgi:hypothetical protein